MPSLSYLEFLHQLRWLADVPIILPALHTIKYTSHNLATVSGILVALNAPSLRYMEVFLHTNDGHCDERVALSGPSNFPSLQRLHLHIFETIPPSDFEKLSRAFPYLVEITLADFNFSAEHLRRIIAVTEEYRVPHNLTVWPQLQTLCIFSAAELPMTELQSFLAKRAAMGLPIRTLRLPADYMEKGRELSACIQPPVTVAELVTDVSPFYLYDE